jgi:hypothetical protein
MELILTLLGNGHKKSAWNLQMPNGELLMMGREDA